MSKIIYDLIQRFEVENGLPHLVSTNIQVIQGGEDLMSLATSILERLGFDENFKRSRASQYVGYRLKNPGKAAKRYQLVLSQRKDGLCISIPQEILWGHILQIGYWINIQEDPGVQLSQVAIIWVKPSQKELFLESLSPLYWGKLQVPEKTVGECSLNECIANNNVYHVFNSSVEYDTYSVIPDSEIIPRHEFSLADLSDNSSFLVFSEDKLFPYTWQVSINSMKDLEEFLGYFGKIIMENVSRKNTQLTL